MCVVSFARQRQQPARADPLQDGHEVCGICVALSLRFHSSLRVCMRSFSLLLAAGKGGGALAFFFFFFFFSCFAVLAFAFASGSTQTSQLWWSLPTSCSCCCCCSWSCSCSFSRTATRAHRLALGLFLPVGCFRFSSSRSPALVILWLMEQQRLTLKKVCRACSKVGIAPPPHAPLWPPLTFHDDGDGGDVHH